MYITNVKHETGGKCYKASNGLGIWTGKSSNTKEMLLSGLADLEYEYDKWEGGIIYGD